MNLFQAIFLPLFAATAVVSLVKTFRRRGRARLNASVVALGAVGAGVVVASPQLSTALSRQFGIGRGADFVLYVGLTVVLYAMLWLYRRVARLERQLTRAVRAQAIEKASWQGSASEPEKKPVR